MGRLSGAFLLNCELFALTLLFALPLGLVVAFGSMSRCKPLAGVVKTFVWVIRGTPLMLQIIVIYLGPGLLGMENPWPSGSGGRMVAAVVAFAINYACYFSEIYRGGIEAIPKGQTEAGQVLGMTKTQIFFKVTLLQVVKRILAQRKGPDLAAVLHCHLLPGLRGRTHPAAGLGRKETGLFPLMKGRKQHHGIA